MIGWLFLFFYTLILTADGKSSESIVAPTIISRQEWGAKLPKGHVDTLHTSPPTYVIVHHAASDTCTNRAICQARVRAFQEYHMNKKQWSDIGYNFLVGEDGNVYEGRGWGKAGAHSPNYNHKSIGICFIGNYQNRAPSDAAIAAAKNLISYGVSQGKIDSKYKLLAHRQTMSTACPGDKLYESIQTWKQWCKNP